MQYCNFLLDAWRIAKAIDRPLSAIHRISFREWVVTETPADELRIQEIENGSHVTTPA